MLLWVFKPITIFKFPYHGPFYEKCTHRRMILRKVTAILMVNYKCKRDENFSVVKNIIHRFPCPLNQQEMKFKLQIIR